MTEPRVRLDMAARKAWLDGEPIHLPRRCFDLLAYLAERPGQVIAHRELMDGLWADSWGSGSTKTVHMHVSWLRRSLGDDPAAPAFIHTVRGLGLRLEPGTVTVIWPEPAPKPEPDVPATRVVLVKKGDVLAIGNVGKVSERSMATAASLRDQLQLSAVLLFEGDIDMTALPGGAM